MNKQSRDGNITWSWEGDTFALRGFNVAITPYGGNPNSESIAKARVENSSRSYTFENITINTDGEYQGWVQAIYEGGDSAWQTTGKISVPDDGTPTIVSSTDGDTIADETEQNAKEYFDSRYIKDEDELIHFDEHLTSTNGMAPDNDYTVTLRDDGKFKGGVAVEEATENLVVNPQEWKIKHHSSYQTVTILDETLFGCVISEAEKVSDGTPATQVASLNIANGETYTASIYSKTISSTSSGNAKLIFYNGSYLASVYATKDGQWERLEVTYTNDTGEDLNNVYIYYYPPSKTGSISQASAPQLEQKPFSTSFTESSRNEGVLNYLVNTPGKSINFYRKGKLTHEEKTDEDFSKGTLTDVVAVNDSLELDKNIGFATENPIDGESSLITNGDYEIIQGTFYSYSGETTPVSFSDGKITQGNWNQGHTSYANNHNIDSSSVNPVIYEFDFKDFIEISDVFVEIEVYNSAYGIDSVEVEKSTNGSNFNSVEFKDVSYLNSETDVPHIIEFNNINEIARYIRVKITHTEGKYLMVNEVGIKGSGYKENGNRTSEKVDLGHISNITDSYIKWDYGFNNSYYICGAGLNEGVSNEKIMINGIEKSLSRRGLNVVRLDNNGNFLEATSYDTYGSSTDSDLCAEYINGLPNTDYIIITANDEPSRNLTQTCIDAIKNRLSSEYIDLLTYRDSWLIFSKIDGEKIAEKHRDRYEGVVDWVYDITVETSTDGGTTWDLCNNKSQIPNIKTADSLMIRETLNTPNSGITSTLSELKAYIYTDEDNEWKMYTINPDGQCYVNAEPVNGSLNSIIDISEDKISFKKNNMFDELLIKDGPVDEATINNWYELGTPFEDNEQKFNTSTPTNVTMIEVE